MLSPERWAEIRRWVAAEDEDVPSPSDMNLWEALRGLLSEYDALAAERLLRAESKVIGYIVCSEYGIPMGFSYKDGMFFLATAQTVGYVFWTEEAARSAIARCAEYGKANDMPWRTDLYTIAKLISPNTEKK